MDALCGLLLGMPSHHCASASAQSCGASFGMYMCTAAERRAALHGYMQVLRPAAICAQPPLLQYSFMELRTRSSCAGPCWHRPTTRPSGCYGGPVVTGRAILCSSCQPSKLLPRAASPSVARVVPV